MHHQLEKAVLVNLPLVYLSSHKIAVLNLPYHLPLLELQVFLLLRSCLHVLLQPPLLSGHRIDLLNKIDLTCPILLLFLAHLSVLRFLVNFYFELVQKNSSQIFTR